MGIGDQGVAAVEDGRVGHNKKSLLPGTTGYHRVLPSTTGYYWVILPNTGEYLSIPQCMEKVSGW